ncbi:hypothetical protein GQ53DRAFT_829509 [Thozetella sp. PMI_491]|nr:hypothetical protein GQ53DRAFT_829509 [Thozetella sp. PMI_491]
MEGYHIENVEDMVLKFKPILEEAGLMGDDLYLALALDDSPLDSSLDARIEWNAHLLIRMARLFSSAEQVYAPGLSHEARRTPREKGTDNSGDANANHVTPSNWINDHFAETGGTDVRLYSDWWGPIIPYFLDPLGVDVEVYRTSTRVVQFLQIEAFLTDHPDEKDYNIEQLEQYRIDLVL